MGYLCLNKNSKSPFVSAKRISYLVTLGDSLSVPFPLKGLAMLTSSFIFPTKCSIERIRFKILTTENCLFLELKTEYCFEYNFNKICSVKKSTY